LIGKQEKEAGMDSWRKDFSKALEINDKRSALSTLACAPSVEALNDTTGNLTVLQEAVSKGQLGIVRSILKAGADVNKESAEVKSPLILAALIGRADIVELLLDAGASANPPEEKPMMTALLCAAVSSGDRSAPMFRLLLGAGAGVDAREPDGRTALHTASRIGGNAEAIAILAEAGADLNALTGAGETPLHVATSAEVFEQLLGLGADVEYLPECAPPGYRTPLDHGLQSDVSGIRKICQSIVAESSMRQIEGALDSEPPLGGCGSSMTRSAPSL
jgi:ankyrin repeat protein